MYYARMPGHPCHIPCSQPNWPHGSRPTGMLTRLAVLRGKEERWRVSLVDLSGTLPRNPARGNLPAFVIRDRS